MRRGLMAWDEVEIPTAALRARVARLQAALARNDQDAILLYTNFIRSAAVSWITAFSPYWADGVVMVPREGEPVFATTLSKRVGNWIQSVAPIRDVVNSATPGAVLGKRLAGQNIRRLAVLELDAFPAGLYDDLAVALPGVDIVDGSETFAAARSIADAAESRLLQRADSIAQAALGQTSGGAANLGEAIAAVEKHARVQGAEEVYIAIAPDLDNDRRFLRLSGPRALGTRFAVRATVAYKGAWVRRTRTYARDAVDNAALGRAEIWFNVLLERFDSKQPVADHIAEQLAELPGAELVNWLAEASVGTRPLAVVASQTEASMRFSSPALILTVSLTVDGVPWCGAGLATR